MRKNQADIDLTRTLMPKITHVQERRVQVFTVVKIRI